MAAESGRIPLNALRVFEAVATHLSFTAAAKELGVTTAAVSAQVKSLEADIGVPLFRRHTRAVALTQEGAELLPGVRRGLEELRRAVDRIRRERVGGRRARGNVEILEHKRRTYRRCQGMGLLLRTPMDET